MDMNMIVEILGKADAHHALGRLDRERCIGGDLGSKRTGARHQFGVRDDVIGQAHIEAFLCRERAAGEDDLGGFCPAEHTRQNHVPPDSGTIPRLTNAAASFALSDMMRMSQPSAVSMP